MQLDQSSINIIGFVSRFGQLTSSQIQRLVFHELLSETPRDRALKRLVADRFLSRIERRLVGGARGGAGQYVYALGSEGIKLAYDERVTPDRVVSHHKLLIADTYLVLLDLARTGSLSIRGYDVEPDCHVTMGKYVLKPDLYAELVRATGSVHIMFEIDQGTQGQKRIGEKLERYTGAAGLPEWPENQIVVFVANSAERAEELKWMIERNKDANHKLFRVHTLESLRANLSG